LRQHPKYKRKWLPKKDRRSERNRPAGRKNRCGLNDFDAFPSQSPCPARTPAATAPQPTIAELFLAFAAISLSGFGGVLAWARRIMVERRRWFTAEQFNEAFALCAFLPGGNMVNFAVIFRRAHARAARCARAAVAGLLGPPMILIIAVGALYAHYGDLPALRRMLTGVAAAAAGLMLATVAKMARPLFKGPFKNRAVVAPLSRCQLSSPSAFCIGRCRWFCSRSCR
jgi:chromate transporter